MYYIRCIIDVLYQMYYIRRIISDVLLLLLYQTHFINKYVELKIHTKKLFNNLGFSKKNFIY